MKYTKYFSQRIMYRGYKTLVTSKNLQSNVPLGSPPYRPYPVHTDSLNMGLNQNPKLFCNGNPSVCPVRSCKRLVRSIFRKF